MTNDGNMLEVNIRVEDPDTFNEPWSMVQRYRRVQPRELGEEACAENNYGSVRLSHPGRGQAGLLSGYDEASPFEGEAAKGGR